MRYNGRVILWGSVAQSEDVPYRLTQQQAAVFDLLAGGMSLHQASVQLRIPEREASTEWDRIVARLTEFAPRSLEDFKMLATFERIQRLAAEAQLWASETRFEALLDIAPSAILVINGRSGRILSCNQEAVALFGYSQRELSELPVEALVPVDVRAKHVQLRNGFLSNVRKRQLGYHPPIVAHRKDGTEIELEIGLTATGATDDVMAVCRPALAGLRQSALWDPTTEQQP